MMINAATRMIMPARMMLMNMHSLSKLKRISIMEILFGLLSVVGIILTINTKHVWQIVMGAIGSTLMITTGSLGVHTVNLCRKCVYSRKLFLVVLIFSIILSLVIGAELLSLLVMMYYIGVKAETSEERILQITMYLVALFVTMIVFILSSIAACIASRNYRELLHCDQHLTSPAQFTVGPYYSSRIPMGVAVYESVPPQPYYIYADK